MGHHPIDCEQQKGESSSFSRPSHPKLEVSTWRLDVILGDVHEGGEVVRGDDEAGNLTESRCSDDWDGEVGGTIDEAEGASEVVGVKWVHAGLVHVQDMLAVKLKQVLYAERSSGGVVRRSCEESTFAFGLYC